MQNDKNVISTFAILKPSLTRSLFSFVPHYSTVIPRLELRMCSRKRNSFMRDRYNEKKSEKQRYNESALNGALLYIEQNVGITFNERHSTRPIVRTDKRNIRENLDCKYD